jgi:quinol-cytochrome oxidoreductase complex cytochrome b subunit
MKKLQKWLTGGVVVGVGLCLAASAFTAILLVSLIGAAVIATPFLLNRHPRLNVWERTEKRRKRETKALWVSGALAIIAVIMLAFGKNGLGSLGLALLAPSILLWILVSISSPKASSK